ncbi:protein ACCELERATED CELL DEATH 6 [Cannabis sativa]|uniref:protein ACCELERATED CELL DEATH 6 n=1 Tax=Cannabis sativa TaxID=3483 RepID=UPI0029CA879B|nr:protein ACCELERATED CELL DEATH 6 [Cannabis sativa]
MGRTALHAAITFQNIGVIKILLEKFGYLTKQPDDAGCVPLHYVMLLPPPFCHTMALEILKMLLEKDKSSAFIKNKRGMTPLHIAPFNNFIGDKIMNEILLRCPDSYEEVDNEGKNVLHHAVIGGHFDNVQFILKHCHYLLNRKDNDGNTPLLHMGATLLSPSWDVCIVEALLSHPRVNKMSLNKDNKNIFDVHLHDYNLTEERIFMFFDKYSIKPYIGKRILDVELNFKNFKKEMKEIAWERIEKLKESSLVTSTLITTVTFAAGFTMPGGYISGEEANQQQGTAILRNNTAFQAFVVTDTIAMVLSASSVFINILFNTLFSRKGSFDDVKSRYFGICMKLTMAAMAFMMIAFVTGTYAVLSLSFPLAITTCLIGLSFFLIIIFTTRKLIHL